MARTRTKWTEEASAELLTMYRNGKRLKDIQKVLKNKHGIETSISNICILGKNGGRRPTVNLRKRENKVIVNLTITVYGKDELDQLLIALKPITTYQHQSPSELRRLKEGLQ